MVQRDIKYVSTNTLYGSLHARVDRHSPFICDLDIPSVLVDEAGADLFGVTGREKRTLVGSLLVSADDEADENVADDTPAMGQFVAWD